MEFQFVIPLIKSSTASTSWGSFIPSPHFIRGYVAARKYSWFDHFVIDEI